VGVGVGTGVGIAVGAGVSVGAAVGTGVPVGASVGTAAGAGSFTSVREPQPHISAAERRIHTASLFVFIPESPFRMRAL
jgi:hypothetical protein